MAETMSHAFAPPNYETFRETAEKAVSQAKNTYDSALARLNIDLAGASFDNVRRSQVVAPRCTVAPPQCRQAYIKFVGGVMPPWE